MVLKFLEIKIVYRTRIRFNKTQKYKTTKVQKVIAHIHFRIVVVAASWRYSTLADTIR